jgi:hypothetical protein
VLDEHGCPMALQVDSAHFQSTQMPLGHSLPLRQPGTQAPLPSQIAPPFSAQGVPMLVGGFEGTPPEHTSSVHTVPSGRTSPSSITATT